MFRRVVGLSAGALALLCLIAAPGRLPAQGRGRPGGARPSGIRPGGLPTSGRPPVGGLRPGGFPTAGRRVGPGWRRPGDRRRHHPERRHWDHHRHHHRHRHGHRRGDAGLFNGLGGLGGGVSSVTNVVPVEDSVGPYLQGAAELTRANAEYLQAIQDARLAREKATQERMRTRRSIIEEAEWERGRLPDPETVRQEERARALDRARLSPPQTEIWSGESLNALLGHLIARRGRGGPHVALDEDTLQAINLTAGDTRGHAGLLKDGGRLHWPPALHGAAFRAGRDAVSRGLQKAVHAARLNGGPRPDTLRALRADLKELDAAVNAGVRTLLPDEYVAARRFLKQVGEAVTGQTVPPKPADQLPHEPLAAVWRMA
jgi:hypothetical protein